jgi:hypothetical protein
MMVFLQGQIPEGSQQPQHEALCIFHKNTEVLLRLAGNFVFHQRKAGFLQELSVYYNKVQVAGKSLLEQVMIQKNFSLLCFHRNLSR